MFNSVKPEKSKLECISRGESKKNVKVSTEFMNHILSLGFNEEDASRLYDQKDDWMGVSTGGSLFCAERGCSFNTKVSSDELFEHCRVKHQWKDYPCQRQNCRYVAYSPTSLKLHSARFHSKLATVKKAFPCSRPDCRASFHDQYLLRVHENVHDNVLIKLGCPNN